MASDFHINIEFVHAGLNAAFNKLQKSTLGILSNSNQHNKDYWIVQSVDIFDWEAKIFFKNELCK